MDEDIIVEDDDSTVDSDDDKEDEYYNPQTVPDNDEDILLASTDETPKKTKTPKKPRQPKEFSTSCPEFLALVVDEAHTFTGPAASKYIHSFREQTHFL